MRNYKNIGLLTLGLVGVATVASAQQQSKPNVILIMADDVGFGDTSCYGAELIETPRIDKLASEGIQFMNAYTCGSTSVPTRYSVLTGQYPIRNIKKVKTKGKVAPLIPDTKKMSIASMFGSVGYRSAAIGKWHQGYGETLITDYTKAMKPGPLELGFDYHFGIPSNHSDAFGSFVKNHYFMNLQPGVEFTKPSRETAASEYAVFPRRMDDHVNLTLANEAMHFIRENHENPFFLYFTPTIAHTHVTPHENFRGKSKAGQYGDYMMELDHYVGQIVDLVDELGIAENTLILFLSDNGGQDLDRPEAGNGLHLVSEAGDVRAKAHTPKIEADKLGHKTNGDYRGHKGGHYEGGFRVPFVARWDGHISTGIKNNAVICTADLMATFADVIGAKIPLGSAIDSKSFLPVLEGKVDNNEVWSVRDEYMYCVATRVGLRKGDWKLISYSQADVSRAKLDELYNIVDDPYETTNLISKNPSIAKRLNKDLADLIGDDIEDYKIKK